MSPYLYDQYHLRQPAVGVGEANGAATSQRLSVIEITSIVGVTVSAAILAFNIWNAIRHEQQQQQSVPLAGRSRDRD